MGSRREDVDPNIDFVSVYIKGLTNAFRLGRSTDDPSKLKTLQLNFWRPGDTVAEQTIDMSQQVSIDVDSHEDGVRKVAEVTIENVKLDLRMPGMAMTYDSTDPAAEKSVLGAAFKGLIKQPYAQKERSAGFLSVTASPGKKENDAKLTFEYFDEKGKLLHKHVK